MSIALVRLQLIGYALFAYQRIIKLSRRASTQDDALLLIVKKLRKRIVALKIPEEGEQPFLLDFDELVIILSALTTFIDSMYILLPQSQERDDVIKVYESLRSYFSTFISENSHNGR